MLDRTSTCSVCIATPDLDNQIYDFLLTARAAVQAADACTSFLFVGDLNGHHQECLGSTTTNRHGITAIDFATVSSCDQLVIGPTHARGGTLDLLMTADQGPDVRKVIKLGHVG